MSLRDEIIAYADAQAPVYQQIALDIHTHPEVSNYEFYACKRLSEQLIQEGFEVTVDVAGHRTGFTAAYKSENPAPCWCSWPSTTHWPDSATAAGTICSAQALLWEPPASSR